VGVVTVVDIIKYRVVIFVVNIIISLQELLIHVKEIFLKVYLPNIVFQNVWHFINMLVYQRKMKVFSFLSFSVLVFNRFMLSFLAASVLFAVSFSVFLKGGTNVQINGVEAILKFWLLLFTAIPDSVFEIHENKIRVLSNGSSVSISKFLYYGTKILKLPTDDDHQSVIYSRSNPGTPGKTTVSTAITDDKKEEKHSFSTFHTGEGNDEGSGDSSNKKLDDSNVIITQVRKTSVPEVATSTRLEENLGRALTDITLSNTYSVTHSTPLIDIKNPNHQVNEFEIREPLAAPLKIIKIGTFSIFINAEKKIYKFEFIHSVKDD
jgi:hypothetical protein